MKKVTGDLLQMGLNGDFDVIFHGCNSFCAMGSGIAAGVRKIYPEAWEVDMNTIKGDKLKLGTITSVDILPDSGEYITVVNAYTQYGFDPKTSPLNYQALE